MKPDAEQTIYDGELLELVLERWGTSEREIVRHPGAVAIVAVDDDEQIVLVRQPRPAVRQRLLELPAGTLEPGEDPLACAQRELAEEVGLRGGRWRELGAFWTSPGFLDQRMHVFLAEDLEQGEAEQEEDEKIEIVRWPAVELEDRIAELEDAKTIAGLLLYVADRR